MSSSENVSDGDGDDSGNDADDTVYLYRIPLDVENGVRKPTYSINVNGTLYMHHTGSSSLVVIQEKASGHLHRESVNAKVKELSKSEVENSDNRIEDFA